MVEASIRSLRFAPDPMPENGIIDEEKRHDESEIQPSGDSDI